MNQRLEEIRKVSEISSDISILTLPQMIETTPCLEAVLVSSIGVGNSAKFMQESVVHFGQMHERRVIPVASTQKSPAFCVDGHKKLVV